LNPDHLISGFKKSGIYPLNRNEILQQLPGPQKDPGGTPTLTHINNIVMSFQKDQISEKQSSAPKRRGKKIVHGKRITPQDLMNKAASTTSDGSSLYHCTAIIVTNHGIVKEMTGGYNVIDATYGIISNVLV